MWFSSLWQVFCFSSMFSFPKNCPVQGVSDVERKALFTMPYGGLWYNTHYVPWKAINSTGTLVRQYILRNTSSLLQLALIKKVCQCKADLFFSGNLHGLQWGFKILPVLEMVLFSSWDPYSGSETEWDGRAGNHQFHSCLSFLNCFLHYFKLVWILLWEEQNTQQSV